MMRKLLVILLALIAMPACSDCIVTEGRYVTSGGNEESTSLTLLPKKNFVIDMQHGNQGIIKVVKFLM